MSDSDPRTLSRVLSPGLLLVLATVVVSGVSNFVNFRAVQGTDVDAWIAVRNALVALMLVPMALLAGSGLRTRLSRRDWARLMTIGLVGGAVPFLLYFRGFQMASAQGGAAAASLGYRSLFLVASVFAVIFLRERLPRRFLLGAAALLAGNALLLSLSGPVWTDGTAYVLAATVLWAGEYTLSKRMLRDMPSGVVALGRMGFGAAFLLAYVALEGHASTLVAFSGGDWMTILLSSLLLFAFVATWYAGLKTVDLTVASPLLVLAFPITWALGVLASGNPVSPEAVAGSSLVAAGAAVIVWAATLGRARGVVPRWLKAQRSRVG